jgi:hypothetical protein
MLYRFQQFITNLVARKAGKTLLALLCVLFLSAQTVDLSHSHGGNSDQQADCDICLKLSSDDEVIIDSSAAQVATTHAVENLVARPTWFAQTTLSAHARAPPHA